jgi:hypothetical protein
MAGDDCGGEKETMKKRDVVFAIVALISITAAAFSHVRRRKAEAFLCGSQMSSIALAAANWAEENHKTLPSNFAVLADRLSTRTLHCPIDGFHRAAKDWASYTPDNASYELLSPGASLNKTNYPSPRDFFLRCSYHDFEASIDGSVSDGKIAYPKAYFGK